MSINKKNLLMYIMMPLLMICFQPPKAKVQSEYKPSEILKKDDYEISGAVKKDDSTRSEIKQTAKYFSTGVVGAFVVLGVQQISPDQTKEDLKSKNKELEVKIKKLKDDKEDPSKDDQEGSSKDDKKDPSMDLKDAEIQKVGDENKKLLETIENLTDAKKQVEEQLQTIKGEFLAVEEKLANTTQSFQSCKKEVEDTKQQLAITTKEKAEADKKFYDEVTKPKEKRTKDLERDFRSENTKLLKFKDDYLKTKDTAIKIKQEKKDSSFKTEKMEILNFDDFFTFLSREVSEIEQLIKKFDDFWLQKTKKIQIRAPNGNTSSYSFSLLDVDFQLPIDSFYVLSGQGYEGELRQRAIKQPVVKFSNIKEYINQWRKSIDNYQQRGTKKNVLGFISDIYLSTKELINDQTIYETGCLFPKEYISLIEEAKKGVKDIEDRELKEIFYKSFNQIMLLQKTGKPSNPLDAIGCAESETIKELVELGFRTPQEYSENPKSFISFLFNVKRTFYFWKTSFFNKFYLDSAWQSFIDKHPIKDKKDEYTTEQQQQDLGEYQQLIEAIDSN